MRIHTVDPFLAQYVYEKQTKPEKTLVWRQFRENDVKAVDRIVELAHGDREAVVTQKDWEIFASLLAFYQERWPDEFNSFVDSVKDIRRSRSQGAYSKSKEMMYVGTLPVRFMKIIKVIFPEQQFDKKFIWKMVNKFKIFKVTKEGN